MIKIGTIEYRTISNNSGFFSDSPRLGFGFAFQDDIGALLTKQLQVKVFDSSSGL
jgi:hypothetical protein